MKTESLRGNISIFLSILFSVIIVAVSFVYRAGVSVVPSDALGEAKTVSQDGLPIQWGNLGTRLVLAGVINKEEFLALHASRGETSLGFKNLLEGENNGYVKITKDNAGLWLNLFWALGLANKNEVLEKGPMTDSRYGGADTFASTGGWTLAKGNIMNHYSMHGFVNLTPAQQELVEKTAKNIYRPCCDNSTYFPDCNHGMAMLGLLELAASQGADEAALYKIAFTANSFWFPDAYQNIGKFLSQKGIDMQTVSPQNILSAEFSSASGYQAVVAALKPSQNKGSSCGV